MCLSGGTCLPDQREQRRGHVLRIMCLSGGTCLPEQREQRRGMRIMCLSGGTCLPEQREQRRMAWNEDNVSEWRDMST